MLSKFVRKNISIVQVEKTRKPNIHLSNNTNRQILTDSAKLENKMNIPIIVEQIEIIEPNECIEMTIIVGNSCKNIG